MQEIKYQSNYNLLPPQGLNESLNEKLTRFPKLRNNIKHNKIQSKCTSKQVTLSNIFLSYVGGSCGKGGKTEIMLY